MASIQVILRNKKNKRGLYPLALRITKDRKSSFIYLDHYIKKSDWDEENAKVRKTYTNSKRLNNLIDKKRADAEKIKIDFDLKDIPYSVEMIKDEMINNRQTNSFFDYAEGYFGRILTEGNYYRHSAEKSAVNHLENFVDGKLLTFSQITLTLLEDFRAYLIGELKLSKRTVFNHLVVIRSIFNKAIKQRVVDQSLYPFGKDGMELKRPVSQKIGLFFVLLLSCWHARI